MDDNLGEPSFQATRDQDADSEEEISAGEDEGPDWTTIPSYASTPRPSLPKRGDKEFEPAAQGPTNLQAHSLNRAREAMFGALGAARGISNKSVSYAIWCPALGRAHVTRARGVHFTGVGHSVARPPPGLAVVDGDDGHVRMHKRTELLPEETLYLIERGSLFCWKDEPRVPPPPHRDGAAAAAAGEAPGEDALRGSPMSVQQAFAEMIGKDGLTLERYHAFAHLKRLGFNVLRTTPPSPAYPAPPPVVPPRPSQACPLARILRPLFSLFARLRSWLAGGVDWWKPLRPGSARDYPSIYRALRLIPSGHNTPLHRPRGAAAPPETPTPYAVFYNIYKPNTPFRKSAPPPPDFSLVVVNARTTPLPTLHELTHLWSALPETGPPPRRRRIRPGAAPPAAAPPPPPSPPPPSVLARLFPWLRGHDHSPDTGPAARKPHPFAVLKGGKKTVVIGVVDSGTVGFFRFGMGAFEETPMI